MSGSGAYLRRVGGVSEACPGEMQVLGVSVACPEREACLERVSGVSGQGGMS